MWTIESSGLEGGAMNSLRLCIRLNEVVGMGVIKERKFHCYREYLWVLMTPASSGPRHSARLCGAEKNQKI